MMRRLPPLLLGAALVFPLLFLLILPLGRQWRFPSLLPEQWTLEHWGNLINGHLDLTESLWLSLLISGGMALSSTFAGFLLSRSVAFSPRQRRWLMLAYLPYLISPVVLATCWQYFFIRSGLSGRVGGVMLGQFLIIFPYAVILFQSFWTREKRAMEQLVFTLGGNAWQAFTKVILPLAKEPLFVCFFQTFLISWFEYGLSTLIGVGKVQTLTIKLYAYINEANIYLAALAGSLLAIPPFLLLWINQRWLKPFKDLDSGIPDKYGILVGGRRTE